MGKSILIINHYAGSLIHGMEYRPFLMAREWVRSGVTVRIVAASFSHLRAKQPLVDKNIAFEVIDGVEYCWIKTINYSSNGVKRFFSMLQFVFKLFWYSKQINTNFSPDAVVASSTYPLDIFPARKFAKKNKSKLVFEVHDLWPLSPKELGGMSKFHPFIVLMQWAEDYAVKFSDIVVSMLPKAIDHLITRGLKPQKYHYIPNGIDLEEWNSTQDLNIEVISAMNEIRKDYKYIVAYTGAHGLANALDSLIDSSSQLKNLNVAVVLVGNGTEKEILVKRAISKGYANVYFFNPIPKKQVPNFLKLCDFLYIGLQKQSLFRFGISPNKMFDYMMAGKPIIQAIEAGNDIASEYSCGLSIEPESSDAVFHAVKHLTNLTEEQLLKMGENGKNAIYSYHNYNILSSNFLNVLIS